MNRECSELGQDDRIPQAGEELRRRLQALLGENLLEVRLYGSWARGQAAPDSDVDLAVIVRRVDLETWQRVQEQTARLSLEHDLVLSVNLLSQQEWEELKRLRTVYAQQLEKEGVLL
jgi:hypothetical protein